MFFGTVYKNLLLSIYVAATKPILLDNFLQS